MQRRAEVTIDRLQAFLDRHPRLFVLTGAGISVASGIPGYRDDNGDWRQPPPVQFRDFVDHVQTRRRYWARSLVGWPRFAAARPNRGHGALAEWESAGRIACLVTQNVDRLHQAAGSTAVIDLHGRLDRVVCLDCGAGLARAELQRELVAGNPVLAASSAAPGPDGDARLPDLDLAGFHVPTCPHCAGTLKPDVVFYGETVPRARVESALAALRAADALLVIGSSLMVYSGFRFCRTAAELGIPAAAVNLGRTRADTLFEVKLEARFEDVADRLRVTAAAAQP